MKQSTIDNSPSNIDFESPYVAFTLSAKDYSLSSEAFNYGQDVNGLCLGQVATEPVERLLGEVGDREYKEEGDPNQLNCNEELAVEQQLQ